MDENQALQLLRNKLREEYDEGVASDLIRALEYVPLAITQASAYILQRSPRMSPSKYLAYFRRNEMKKTSLLQRAMADLQRDPRASNSVIATWQITFEGIRQDRKSAADLLVFMSFFNPQDIPEWVLRSYKRRSRGQDMTIDDGRNGARDEGSSDEEFEDDLDILCEYSLVATTTDKDVFEMHALVQFCTQVWFSSFDDAHTWKRTFLHVASIEYPEGKFENWTKCRMLDPHIKLIIEEEPENETDAEDLARLLTNAGQYRQGIGKYTAAYEMLRKAVRTREAKVGMEHPCTLTSVNVLASVLHSQGKYEEAEEMSRRALSGREKELGKEHPDTLSSATNLASVLQSQGKYTEAEKMNRRALIGREKVLGEEHPDALTSAGNLALALQSQGKHKEAEEMSRRALNGYVNALGEEHPSTLASVNILASVLQSQGKYTEAEKMSQQALIGREKVLGEGHPDTLTSISNLALALQSQGKYTEVKEMNQPGLAGRKNALYLLIFLVLLWYFYAALVFICSATS
jgi:tetratricopeptide (TPR) repeat protein